MKSLYDIEKIVYEYLKGLGMPLEVNSYDSSLPSVSIDVSLDLSQPNIESGKLFSEQFTGGKLVVRTPFILTMLLQAGKSEDKKTDKENIEKLLKDLYFAIMNFRFVDRGNLIINLDAFSFRSNWLHNGILGNSNIYETRIAATIGGTALYE